MSRHSIYLPDHVSAAMQAEAERLNKPLAWVVGVAWTIAAPHLKAEPGPDAAPQEPCSVEDVETIWGTHPSLTGERGPFFRTIARLGVTRAQLSGICQFVEAKLDRGEAVKCPPSLVLALCRKKVALKGVDP
jgi:hypothetical protein